MVKRGAGQIKQLTAITGSVASWLNLKAGRLRAVTEVPFIQMEIQAESR